MTDRNADISASFATTAQIGALTWNTSVGRWNSPMPLGTPTFVTYNFMQSVPSYDQASRVPGFTSFTAAQEWSARNALSAWSANSGIVFLEVPSTFEADIRFGSHAFAGTANSSAAAYAYLPVMDTSGTRNPIGGDIWFDTATFAGDNLSSGFGFFALLHEIGHAIGFKHPFEGPITLPTAEDNTTNTVMSYTGARNSVMPAPFDIAASQYYYGVNKLPYFWDWPNWTLTTYGSAASENILGINLNDICSGGAGNDSILGLGGNDWLFGGDGSDIIRGGIGNDVLYGDLANELGSDNLLGEAGNDILIGGAMLDILEGGQGDDWLFGSDGGDILRGGDGIDVVYGDLFAGEAGTDVIEGGAGADTLIGGEGNDVIHGGVAPPGFVSGDGADWLYGGNGSDQLFGDAGGDILYGDFFAGEIGNDLLNGGAGADIMSGGLGDDTLVGGADSDTMTGGVGADVFVYANRFDAVRDVVEDFAAGSGGDRLDFRGAGFSSFTFAGFMSAYAFQRGANVVLDFDGSGTTTEITLKNVTLGSLTASNFIFV